MPGLPKPGPAPRRPGPGRLVGCRPQDSEVHVVLVYKGHHLPNPDQQGPETPGLGARPLGQAEDGHPALT